jgi:anaerobic selenocysteine-containing dehydrogenase
VQVPVTNLVAKPEVEAAFSAAGSVVNTFAPGVGSILALALAGLYHGYRQVRNRNVIHYYAEIIRENGILLLMCGRMCGILLDVKRNAERWVAAGRKNETDHHLCHSNSESNGTVGHAILGTHVTKLAAGASSFASV